MPAIPRPRLHWANLIALTVAYAAVVLLWRTPVVYPLRLLVVFLHEGPSLWLSCGQLPSSQPQKA